MSDLDRFELFVQVAQAKSLSHAAISLGMTKASLSKQIKQLETEVKVDLFSRQGRQLKLTDQGRLLLAQCLRLKKELDNTRSLCQQLLDEPEGSLRIVAFEFFAKKLIFPHLKSFMKLHPKIQLFIDTSERIPDFEGEQVDLAVGFSLPAPLDIVQKRIATTRYILCGSPEYFAKHGKPRQLKELESHYYIRHSGRPDEQAIKLKTGHQVFLRHYLTLNSVTSMIECAKQGIGLIQLPLYLLETALANGELVEILNAYQATNAHVYYYYPRYRHVQPKVRKFIDFFLNIK